ncbi:nucleotidyltransferase family protein [Paenibacillus sp. FSL M7-0420]|uniref:nucleotidyltransferase family protein n=1 Tax=Paenibacillus sp. FSL M7-0420 TaxID=2921609 RepID=UPI0030F76444
MDNDLQIILKNFLEITRTRFIPGQEDLITKFLLELILLHKLEGRVSQDLQHLEDKIQSTNLTQTLDDSRYRNQLRFLKQCQLAKEIVNLFQRHNFNEFPILIKGISIYGLTNQAYHIRRSVDMDLIYSDPASLVSLLMEIGFAKINEDGISDHEFSTMVREELVIDIHKFIPVFGYSEGMLKKALRAEKHIFFESFTKLTSDKISYSDLNQDAYAVPNFGGMRVPDVHYQVLILCAHLFKNFVHSLFHCSSGIILAELLDIRDLLRRPSFDVRRFELIITSNEKSTSVNFARELISLILGESSLQELAYDPNRAYPKFILWNGLMYLPTRPNDYIYSNYSDFTERLGAESFNLRGRDTKILIPDIEAFNSHGVRQVNLMTLKRQSDQLDIRIELINRPNSLSCDVIEMAFEGKRCCFSFDGSNIEVEEQSEGCSFGFTIGEDQGYVIHIKIPVGVLSTPFVSQVGLVICVTRWGDGPLSTLIPVNILL